MNAGEIILPFDASVLLMIHSPWRAGAEVIHSRYSIDYLCNADYKVLPNGDPVIFAALLHDRSLLYY